VTNFANTLRHELLIFVRPIYMGLIMFFVGSTKPWSSDKPVKGDKTRYLAFVNLIP
jgi:hypothetical protein